MDELWIIIPLLVALIGFGVWLFLIAPKRAGEMEKYKSVKYAHRGLHGDFGDGFAAENSLTAFDRAASLGFGIELDIRLAADGELVVFHDATLDRVTGVSGKVIDKTSAELGRLSLLGTADVVPTFKELLDLIDGRVPLLVEIKEDSINGVAAEKAAEVLAEYKGDYIIESFNPMALGVIRKKLPSAMRGFLSDKHTERKETSSLIHRITQRFLLNFIARPHFIAMRKTRSGMFPLPFVRAVFGIPTIAWTVRSPEEEREAYENKFDGVIFEKYIPDEKIGG